MSIYIELHYTSSLVRNAWPTTLGLGAGFLGCQVHELPLHFINLRPGLIQLILVQPAHLLNGSLVEGDKKAIQLFGVYFV